MAKKSHKCPKCSRSFSLPAHLARHLNTTHATVKTKAAKKRRPKPKRKLGLGKPVGRTVSRPKPKVLRRGTPLDGTMAALVESMRVYQAELASRRDGLNAEFAAIDAAVVALQSGEGKRRSKRVRRAKHR